MKKLFALAMVAVMALVVGCKPAEEPAPASTNAAAQATQPGA